MEGQCGRVAQKLRPVRDAVPLPSPATTAFLIRYLWLKSLRHADAVTGGSGGSGGGCGDLLVRDIVGIPGTCRGDPVPRPLAILRRPGSLIHGSKYNVSSLKYLDKDAVLEAIFGSDNGSTH